jgi:CRP/FNR family transcriptional regulator, anaerobic regulatory protein
MEPLFNKADCQHCRLAGICLPCGLACEEVSQLETIVSRRRPLKPEEYLYRQEDHADSIYVVKSGSFRGTMLDSEGVEQTADFYLPGEVMGLDALQKGSFRCSAVALETSAVCELPMTRLNDLCTKIPRLQSQLLHIIGTQISLHQEHVALLGNQSASAKLGAFLLMLSQRYSALGYSSTEFNLSMDRHDIASFLSLTVETVSRQLTKLKDAGIVSVKRRGVQINNMDSLRAVA